MLRQIRNLVSLTYIRGKAKKDTFINLKCDYENCNNLFYRRIADYKRTKLHFCSAKCCGLNNITPEIEYTCQYKPCCRLFLSKESRRFCSQKCSCLYLVNERMESPEIYNSIYSKVSDSMKLFAKENPEVIRKNISNNNLSTRFSSKGERELLGIIKENFKDYKWQSGGLWNIGNSMYKSIDIYCRDLKIIIEYDGIYHFKDIRGDLSKIQEKDTRLNNWCVETGWKIIRINEATYRSSKRKEAIDMIFHLIQNYDTIESVNILYWIPEYIKPDK